VRKAVNSQCRAFQEAIQVVARPWNALILNVLQTGPLRFSELAVAARGPGDKVLSARLKQLEESGLILRHVEAGPPVRVAYELTAEGRGFGEVANAIERWGRCLCPRDAASSNPTKTTTPNSKTSPVRRHAARTSS
jgi:DNA-binding HxlR family transcriptional regulator